MSKTVISYADLAANPAYELVAEEYLDDWKIGGIILRHKKSGARVCLLPCDDENKLFCAAFRTPPTDSTGVPHIIEHTVLNGSERYPSRDPFMQLAKGSLNTFLNAMTFPDKTMYPVSSCNDKDFLNLMGVYMDAVFCPNIGRYRQIFMQEGWHYELENADDELKINGVVYSEMKGDLSSPDTVIYDGMTAALFPDTAYGVNSGGDPDVIPSLTYEAYLDFYRKHYHPANAYLFLYGNCDMDERLRFMDTEYLSRYDAAEPSEPITHQKRWNCPEPKHVTRPYSVGAEEETAGKAYLAYAAVGSESRNVLECRAWNVLSDVLLEADGAPLREALIDAGIGEDIYGGVEDHMIDEAFAVVAKNADEADAERFYRVIRDTLEEQVKNGISEKALLATINRIEFHVREADYGGYPRGLDLAECMMKSWLYDDGAPFAYLHVLSDYAELKKRIGTGWYEELVRRTLLGSDHAILLTLTPERGLVDKKNAELKEKLAAYKASLTTDEVAHIVEETRLLREYQSRPASPEELDCIPTLERNDIPVDTTPFYNEERTIGGVRTVFHDIETNGITYAGLCFDLDRLPRRFVPYVGLLGQLLSRLDTKAHTYAELDVDIRLHTGMMVFEPTVTRLYGTMDDYRPMFRVQFRAMPDEVEWAMQTALEVLTDTRLDDKKRIRVLLGEIKSDKQRAIMNNGDRVAAARARSYFSRYDCYLQALDGLDFYRFVSDSLEHFDERADDLIENLKKTAAALFDPAKLLVSLAADRDGVAAMEKTLPAFAAALGKRTVVPLGEGEEFVPEKKNEGILTPSQVQYVARVGNLRLAGLSADGAIQVVKTAVNSDWLYQEIRVKGGAYGCGCSIAVDSGTVQFTSYRDPKLAETNEVYKKTAEFVRSASYSEKELTRFIIGTFSPFERPLSPAGKAARSFSAYLSGQTYENVVRMRREMLGVTMESFRKTADLFEAAAAQDNFCVVGSESKVEENRALFGSLVRI